MFVMLADAIGWIPLVIRLPLLGFMALVALVVLIRLAVAFLSIFTAILEILLPWK